MLSRNHSAKAAFTLIELLVVIGIIALLASLVGLGLRGGNQSSALQAAQGTISSLLSLTRAQAALKGANARLLINANSNNRERFLRYCVVEYQNVSPQGVSTWVPLDAGVYLPVGIAVMPNRTSLPPGLSGGSGALMPASFGGINLNWTTPKPLSSGALRLEPSIAVNSTQSEAWYSIEITTRGTTGSSGDIIIGPVEQNAASAGSAPFVFSNPDNVRGVAVSTYGVLTFINERLGF